MNEGSPTSRQEARHLVNRCSNSTSEITDESDLLPRLRVHLDSCGQLHLLRNWSTLNQQERQELAGQILSLDTELLTELLDKDCEDAVSTLDTARMDVPTTVRGSGSGRGRDSSSEAGKELLHRGAVGVLIVAGGNGSRLGFEAPKGCFPIGPVAGTTLFEFLLSRAVAAYRQYGAVVPVYVMTSPATHDETVEFLNAQNWFGVPAEGRHVFCQGTMPAVNFDNQILMETPSRLCLSPDGHGGIVSALASSGLLESMRESGVEQLFYAQIDNAAAPLLDPELIGLHVEHDSEVTILVVDKVSPTERVGTVVSIDGKTHIIEYTLIPDDISHETDEDGKLRFRAANTGMHLFSRSFLEKCASEATSLPFHRAVKKVAHLGEGGCFIEPDEPNAVKFERFIFDAFPQAERSLLIEVAADSTFLPLKDANSTTTSPPAVRRQLSEMYRTWLSQAGVNVAENTIVEISPRFAANADQLAERLNASGGQLTSPVINGSLYLDEQASPSVNVKTA